METNKQKETKMDTHTHTHTHTHTYARTHAHTSVIGGNLCFGPHNDNYGLFCHFIKKISLLLGESAEAVVTKVTAHRMLTVFCRLSEKNGRTNKADDGQRLAIDSSFDFGSCCTCKS